MQPQANFTSPSPSDLSQLCGLPSLSTLVDHHETYSHLSLALQLFSVDLSHLYLDNMPVTLFPTFETNNVISYWSVTSLFFFLQSLVPWLLILQYSQVTLSSLVCTHCVRFVSSVLFCLTSVHLMAMCFDIVVRCWCHFFQIKFSLFFQGCL